MPTKHEKVFTKILVKSIKAGDPPEAQQGIIAELLRHSPDIERVNAAIMKAGSPLRIGQVRQ